MTYHDELRKAMVLLADQPNTIFLGQGVRDNGTSMASTFSDVPMHKRLEMPVAEELQMGMAIGMALQGYLPICVFPRWNFMLRAADQIINHLDRLPIYSGGEYKPKVIIRTAVPSTEPFNPQAQHDDDFSGAFDSMFRTIGIRQLRDAERVVLEYQEILEIGHSMIMVEFTHSYKDERGRLQCGINQK